jgi:hypothetical protein
MLPTPEPSQIRPRRGSRKRILQPDGTFSQSFYSQADLNPLVEYIENTPKRRRRLSFEVYEDSLISLESPKLGDSRDINESQIAPQDSLLEEIIPNSDILLNESNSDQSATRPPLVDIDTNIPTPKHLLECLKPNLPISWSCVKKWQENQPNDHTSNYYTFSIYLYIYISTILIIYYSSFYKR